MEATRGPLCILAGAGTGKTTTITRRIAWQVASGAFPPGQIVAVTFTDKAAGELRARLRALGTDGRARLDLPLGGTRAATPLRRGSGPDPPLEGAAAAADRQLAAGGVPLPARRRPRDGDRVGEEPAPHTRHVPRLARRPRAADPARPLAAGVPGVRAAQGRRGAARLRGPARAGGAAARRGRGRARGGARPLARLHRRRVPGRQPAPAVAARPLARRPGRPLRGRRRLPGDLRLHGRERRVAARAAAALPPRSRRAARAELPLDRRR